MKFSSAVDKPINAKPHVVINLLTYNRLQYAKITLESTLENVVYDGPLSIHIADDGSPDGYVDSLVKIASEYCDLVTTSNSNRAGYGANFNLSTQIVHDRAEVVLPLEDDWQLVRPLKLDNFIPALDIFKCIRMGYLGFTQTLRGDLVNYAGAVWLKFFPQSYEPHVFAGHPRLETVEYEKAVGLWPENLEPGMTEFAVAKKDAARIGVVWPMEYVKPSGDLFCHVGTIRSY